MVAEEDAVLAEVEKRLAQHAKALGSGDVEACLRLYSDDAIVRPANMPPVQGKEELESFFENWFSLMSVEGAVYRTDEFTMCGDWANQIGTYSGTYVPKEGEPAEDRGNFHIVWKQQSDGSWRYHRGIFNSQLPADATITEKES